MVRHKPHHCTGETQGGNTSGTSVDGASPEGQQIGTSRAGTPSPPLEGALVLNSSRQDFVMESRFPGTAVGISYLEWARVLS